MLLKKVNAIHCEIKINSNFLHFKDLTEKQDQDIANSTKCKMCPGQGLSQSRQKVNEILES